MREIFLESCWKTVSPILRRWVGGFLTLGQVRGGFMRLLWAWCAYLGIADELWIDDWLPPEDSSMKFKWLHLPACSQLSGAKDAWVSSGSDRGTREREPASGSFTIYPWDMLGVRMWSGGRVRTLSLDLGESMSHAPEVAADGLPWDR